MENKNLTHKESSQKLIEYEIKANRMMKKKPWHKHFTSVQLALMFFGSAFVYIILNIVYFEIMKFIILE